MRRRKFLIGAGSIAAGSAAAMGSGAFSAVRAERNINVGIAGDSNAYLGLVPEGPYAEYSGNQLVLSFTGGNGEGGQGLNVRADTTFSNVFKIVNQGTNTIRVQLGDDDSTGPLIGQLPQDGPLAMFYSFSELSSPSVGNYTPFAASPAPSYYPGSDVTNQDLAPGDEMWVHMAFYLNEDVKDSSLGSGASTDIADVPDDLGIYADATPDTGGL